MRGFRSGPLRSLDARLPTRIEANECYPSMQMIHELASRLDVDPQWLATGATASSHDDLRAQLRAAHASRRLESKIEAVARIVRD